jgi:hypothetical protein
MSTVVGCLQLYSSKAVGSTGLVQSSISRPAVLALTSVVARPQQPVSPLSLNARCLLGQLSRLSRTGFQERQLPA